ncbi:MAG: 4-alpha-glucanotransferase [Bryobacteraceae bacterium]
MHDYEQALDQAARLWGVEPQYWDIWGTLHVTPAVVKTAILKALGIAVESAGELRDAVRERLHRAESRLLPPCLVLSQDDPRKEFSSNAPGGTLKVRIAWEDGSVSEYQHEGQGQIQIPLPGNLPLGYHEVEVRAGGAHEAMWLIVTPSRAYWPPAWDDPAWRSAGVAIALYGIRSGRNWGCGDLTDLQGVVDWVGGDVKASFVALNPLHAIHNRRPYNTSPYLPNCVFYQNPLYLDVESIEDFATSRRAQALRCRPDIDSEIAALRASEFVEYERLYALKLRFLKLLFVTFLYEKRQGREVGRSAEFESFIGREGDLLHRYALYCALDEHLHARNPDMWTWPQWPEQYRDPESAETREFALKHWRSVLFYKYLQWQLDRQLAAAQKHCEERGLSIGLYHDLALATDRFGSDLWAHRPFYVAGCRVGSPPDDFAPKGQDWGFPPPNGDRHYESGYRLFTESIRKNCRHGGALRIDHVMRFFRLYWIPDNMDATQGAYVRDRHEDLVRILALESVRNKVVLIGEDLGTVEPSIRETLQRYGILSYRLLYFEKHPDGSFRKPDEYPVQALVSSTTHDLPTLAGFWLAEDIEARRRAGLLDEGSYHAQRAERAREKQKMLDLLLRLDLLPSSYPRAAPEIPELTGELHNAIVGFLALTPSRLLAINQEDLTKEIHQQNLPASTWQYPNWGRKMKFTVEELQSAEILRDFTAMFRHWLDRTGRANVPTMR